MSGIPDYETEKNMTFDFPMICFLSKQSSCLILFCVGITAMYHYICFLDTYMWKETPLAVHSWVMILIWSEDRPQTCFWPPTTFEECHLTMLMDFPAYPQSHSCDSGSGFAENSYYCDNRAWSHKHCHPGLSSSAPKKKFCEWIHATKAASDCQSPRKSTKYIFQQRRCQCVVTPLRGQSLC